MNAEKLLKTLPVLQAQLDSLLEFDCSANDLTNGVISMAFMILFRDLIRLFACYNDGIINLLGERKCGFFTSFFTNITVFNIACISLSLYSRALLFVLQLKLILILNCYKLYESMISLLTSNAISVTIRSLADIIFK
jgi:hypothetical protein